MTISRFPPFCISLIVLEGLLAENKATLVPVTSDHEFEFVNKNGNNGLTVRSGIYVIGCT